MITFNRLIHRGSAWKSVPKHPPFGYAGQQARDSSLWAVCMGRVKQVWRGKKRAKAKGEFRDSRA